MFYKGRPTGRSSKSSIGAEHVLLKPRCGAEGALDVPHGPVRESEADDSGAVETAAPAPVVGFLRADGGGSSPTYITKNVFVVSPLLLFASCISVQTGQCNTVQHACKRAGGKNCDLGIDMKVSKLLGAPAL